MELGGKYLCLSDIFLSSFSRLAGRWLPLVELVERGRSTSATKVLRQSRQ